MNLTDRLEQISALISELRACAADGRKSRQLIDSLFRTVHSFKAAAAAEGHEDLSRTAHEFENLLHSLRTGQITLNDETLRAFEETAVAMRNGSEAASLTSLYLHERANQTPQELPPEFAALKDDERHHAAEAMREGSNLYVISAVFEVSDFDERFRQLKERLEENAELISTSASMGDDQIIFQVFYAARSEKIPSQTVLRHAVRAGELAARKLAKQINFVVKGEEFLLDRQWADVLADAIIHLVRNAVDHGIESNGTVTLDATTTPNGTLITVTDDGRGIAPEALPLLFQPGFSTVKQATEFSGRGVGLDAVKTSVEELGGRVTVTSEPGKGSSFKINIPKIKIPNPSSDA